MPEIHLRKPTALDKSGFIYSSCLSFTTNKEKIQKLKKDRRFTIYLSKQTR